MKYSGFALLEENNWHQTCDVETAAYPDENGITVFENRRTVKCRITLETSRSVGDRGDQITSKNVKIYLSAKDPIQSGDRVHLPLPWGANGPILASVTTTVDDDGSIGHKEVTVL